MKMVYLTSGSWVKAIRTGWVERNNLRTSFILKSSLNLKLSTSQSIFMPSSSSSSDCALTEKRSAKTTWLYVAS